MDISKTFAKKITFFRQERKYFLCSLTIPENMGVSIPDDVFFKSSMFLLTIAKNFYYFFHYH